VTQKNNNNSCRLRLAAAMSTVTIDNYNRHKLGVVGWMKICVQIGNRMDSEILRLLTTWHLQPCPSEALRNDRTSRQPYWISGTYRATH